MSQQLDWIGEGRYSASMSTHPEPRPERLARRHDSETSKRAAEKAVETFVASHEAKCFGAICDAAGRGATSDEIAAATGLTLVQVCRRLGKMGERKLIVRRLNDHPASSRDFKARDGMAIWWRA